MLKLVKTIVDCSCKLMQKLCLNNHIRVALVLIALEAKIGLLCNNYTVWHLAKMN